MSLLKKLLRSSAYFSVSINTKKTHAGGQPQPFSNMEKSATILSLEREVDRLVAENFTLRRTIETLNARLEPSQAIIDHMRQQLEEQERSMAQLANEIKLAVEKYEKAIEIYEDGFQQRDFSSGLGEATGYAKLIDQLENDMLTWSF